MKGLVILFWLFFVGAISAGMEYNGGFLFVWVPFVAFGTWVLFQWATKPQPKGPRW